MRGEQTQEEKHTGTGRMVGIAHDLDEDIEIEDVKEAEYIELTPRPRPPLLARRAPRTWRSRPNPRRKPSRTGR